MKTKIIIMASLAFAFTLSAQKGNVSSVDYELEAEKPDLEKAEEKILAAEKHEKTVNYPKTYVVKSRLYRAKYTKDKEDIKSLLTAFDAIKKAEELDIKGDAKGKGKLKFRDDIKKNLVMLRYDMQSCASEAYNNQDYATATQCFENVLAIDKMASVQEKGQEAGIDTAIIYYTGLAAYYSEDKEKTAQYMQECIDYGYGKSTPHTVMYFLYKEAGDSTQMLQTLKDGFEKYPEDAVFLRELVNYYVITNDLEQGMKYINLALENDPENSFFWFVKGTFHDQSKEPELSIEAYQKALETAQDDEQRYNANYNIGVVYYNQAVEAENAASAEQNMEKSMQMSKKAKEKVKLCIPYFERCIKLKTDDVDAYRALSPAYYRLSDDPAMMKKYEEAQEKLR